MSEELVDHLVLGFFLGILLVVIIGAAFPSTRLARALNRNLGPSVPSRGPSPDVLSQAVVFWFWFSIRTIAGGFLILWFPRYLISGYEEVFSVFPLERASTTIACACFLLAFALLIRATAFAAWLGIITLRREAQDRVTNNDEPSNCSMNPSAGGSAPAEL